MIERGHDVQLHIHPHWHSARYDAGYFRLGRNWNIATYDEADRKAMLSTSIAYLEELIGPIRPGYQVTSFKAGAWALQPSHGILGDLASFGIALVTGVGKGICYR